MAGTLDDVTTRRNLCKVSAYERNWGDCTVEDFWRVAATEKTMMGPFHLLVIALAGWLNRPLRKSPHNLQPRGHRLIQQINRLFEPLIFDECRIRFLSCLDRSMPQQVLNICS